MPKILGLTTKNRSTARGASSPVKPATAWCVPAMMRSILGHTKTQEHSARCSVTRKTSHVRRRALEDLWHDDIKALCDAGHIMHDTIRPHLLRIHECIRTCMDEGLWACSWLEPRRRRVWGWMLREFRDDSAS